MNANCLFLFRLWYHAARLAVVNGGLSMAMLGTVGCAMNRHMTPVANVAFTSTSTPPHAKKSVTVQRVSTRKAVEYPDALPDESSARAVFPPPSSPSFTDPPSVETPLAPPLEPSYKLTPLPQEDRAPRRLSIRNDAHALPKRFLGEIESLVTCENFAFLGAAGGLAAVLHNNVDPHAVNPHPLDGRFSDVVTDFGDAFPVQLPIIGGLYLTSLYWQDEDLHDLTLTMFTTYKFTLLGSVALQYATNTRHTNNGVFNIFTDSGFPSEHTATTFALAAVLDEAFGWQAGVPAYLFAGVIGWAEVDQNQHTVSEVVFGAAFGYVIGKSIGALHYRPDAPFKLVPFVDTYSGSQGLGMQWTY